MASTVAWIHPVKIRGDVDNGERQALHVKFAQEKYATPGDTFEFDVTREGTYTRDRRVHTGLHNVGDESAAAYQPASAPTPVPKSMNSGETSWKFDKSRINWQPF